MSAGARRGSDSRPRKHSVMEPMDPDGRRLTHPTPWAVVGWVHPRRPSSRNGGRPRPSNCGGVEMATGPGKPGRLRSPNARSGLCRGGDRRGGHRSTAGSPGHIAHPRRRPVSRSRLVGDAAGAGGEARDCVANPNHVGWEVRTTINRGPRARMVSARTRMINPEHAGRIRAGRCGRPAGRGRFLDVGAPVHLSSSAIPPGAVVGQSPVGSRLIPSIGPARGRRLGWGAALERTGGNKCSP